MEAIQSVEPAKATEYTTTVDTCPTCISGTDPLIDSSSAGMVAILQDSE